MAAGASVRDLMCAAPPRLYETTLLNVAIDIGLGNISIEAHMATLPNSPERSPEWSAEAMAMAAQARVLSGSKLEQLVVRLQRQTGRPKEACWRFIIQHGIKGQPRHACGVGRRNSELAPVNQVLRKEFCLRKMATSSLAENCAALGLPNLRLLRNLTERTRCINRACL